MKELTPILEQLASKLGTTMQYLWSILIKQAYISATITLMQIILVLIAGIVLVRLHIRFSKSTTRGTGHNSGRISSLYEKHGDILSIPMIIISIVWLILAIACFFCISDVINGYFNPEYWALDTILSKIKSR